MDMQNIDAQVSDKDLAAILEQVATQLVNLLETVARKQGIDTGPFGITDYNNNNVEDAIAWLRFHDEEND